MKKLNVYYSELQKHAVADGKVKQWFSIILNGKNAHVATTVQFNQLRVAVKNNQLEPFSIMFNGLKLDIGEKGQCSEWPDGFFDQQRWQMKDLMSPVKNSSHS